MAREDFISAYFSYVGDTEAPATFHRWSCLSILGAYLGRSYRFHLGHFKVFPNIYCMLMGDAGTRKSTAIKIASGLLRKSGYTSIAAERTTKEKFLLDLAGDTGDTEVSNADKFLESRLFGNGESGPSELFVAADEFNTFVGNGNIEFLSMLGVLWDYDGTFSNRVKNSKSIEIQDPTVSILAGNTPTGFSLAFPIEAIGQGIFSRLVLVHGEKTGKRITFPEAPDAAATTDIINLLQAVKVTSTGIAEITNDAKSALDKIYKSWAGVDDVRFDSYSNRRFTHLLKLCLITSAAALKRTIDLSDVVYANTILTHAEHTMPKALGEFGKSRNSDVAHKVLHILEGADGVISRKVLWKQVHNDLESMTALGDILNNLLLADKILSTNGGYLAKRRILEETGNDLIDFSLLSDEERKYVS